MSADSSGRPRRTATTACAAALRALSIRLVICGALCIAPSSGEHRWLSAVRVSAMSDRTEYANSSRCDCEVCDELGEPVHIRRTSEPALRGAAPEIDEHRAADGKADQGTPIASQQSVQGITREVYAEKYAAQTLAPLLTGPESHCGGQTGRRHHTHQWNCRPAQQLELELPVGLDPPHGVGPSAGPGQCDRAGETGNGTQRKEPAEQSDANG